MLEIKWRCRDNVRLEPGADGVVSLVVDGESTLPLHTPSASTAQRLAGLNDGLADRALAPPAGDAHDPQASALLLYLRERLRLLGLLVADLLWHERLLATLRPLSREFNPAVAPTLRARGSRSWQLSRFAFLRRDGSSLVLESPEAPCDVLIRDQDLVGWLHEAAGPVTPEPGSMQAEVLALLASLAFVDDPELDEPAARKMWEFHDRLFHHKVQREDDAAPFGNTYRFSARASSQDFDQLPPPAAIRAPYDGDTIALPVPAATESQRLFDVMETRRSQRDMGDRPVSLPEVAALLYRVARITKMTPGTMQELLLRPYPSGGAIHELEFYLAVRTCTGLAPGFYHYRGADHALTSLTGACSATAAMIDWCAQSWGRANRPPQCLAVLSSRLPRLSWKYESIAYRLSLLNAGCALQSLYVVATDLGLNGAASGASQPDLFAQATGVSSWEETSIAEFGFGSRPDDA